MSNYEISLKASLDNLSDEEISKKLRAGYFTDEARPVAEQILKERGFASNNSIEKNHSHKITTESSDYLTYEQNKKYIKGNAIVWMVTLFLIGANPPPLTTKNLPADMFFRGLIFSIIGTIIYLIYIKLRKKKWTIVELKKSYSNNFIGALIVIGLAFISTISKIFINVAGLMAKLDLVVLAIILIMYVNNKKSSKQALAVYSLITIAIALIFDNGYATIWAFGFLVSAKSILINEVINPEIDESS